MSLLAVLDLIVNLIDLWRAARSGREGLQRWWRKRTGRQTEEPIERLIGEVEGVRTQLGELKTRLSHPSFASDSQFMLTDLPRISLINRQREIDVIHRALRDGPGLKIIYFLGPGGAGKTRLLEQVSYIVGNSVEGRTTLWGGLIDLYHSETHTPIGLMDSLILQRKVA